MFLWARNVSMRSLDVSITTKNALNPPYACVASSNYPELPLYNCILTLNPPFLRYSNDSIDSVAYLQLLYALTHQVAQIVGVHTLSSSLRFIPNESVAVDAVEWWKEVQKQSIALVQQEEVAVMAQQVHNDNERTPSHCIWPLTIGTRTKVVQPKSLYGWVLAETFEDLLEDMVENDVAVFFVQAFYLIIKTLDRTNRNILIHQDNGRENETVLDALASVEEAMAFAAAELLQRWASLSQKTTVENIALNVAKSMGVVVVNVLLQSRKMGTRHSFHEHVLLPSMPLRVFVEAKKWECSACKRIMETAGFVTNRAVCVYRCAACNFNLCLECYTRIPNSTSLHCTTFDMTKLRTHRFFALVVPRLKHPMGPIVIRQIAQELRRRVLELYPHNFLGAAEFVQMFYNLLKSDKSAAVELVRSPPASMPLSGGPTVAWFPLFMRTWTMSLSTLLGPFLRASTMLNDTYELDAAVRATNGFAAAKSLRDRWTDGYAKLRDMIQCLMRTLLADDQHPLVVDATLSWLALTLMTADPRRRFNNDACERIDGFLVNVTTMLLAHTLPVLKIAQHDPSYIDSSYHQSLEPVRAYGSKDFPEVPLHYSRCCTQNTGANNNASDVEACRITARDDACIRKYQARSTELGQDLDEIPSTYYPVLSCHEGVVCDQCESSHFHGVRYKCAFCGDMDLCSDCFETFRAHQACTDSVSETELEIIAHNVDHVFLRVESPIPVFALKHFQKLAAEWMTSRNSRSVSCDVVECTGEKLDAPNMRCVDCGDGVGASGKPDDVFYKCANCFSTRAVCAACLAHEEMVSNGNPNNLHAPGHVYFVITEPWRRQLPISLDEALRKLHFRRLLHPPALIPRLRFPLDTELFYLTLQFLHFGPLATLSRWLSMAKEMQDLQAICTCDEEQHEVERRRQGRRRQNDSQGKPLQQLGRYKANKARLEDIRVKREKMELHLLASANVAEWLLFYARTCRWLLHTASTSSHDSETTLQDPYSEPLSRFSSTFSALPEHFFFDLCNVVYFLGLEKFDYHDLVTELNKRKHKTAEVVDEDVEVVDPLMVMLTQIIVASEFTKNPHLRVEALRSLTTLVMFVTKGQQAQYHSGCRRMESLLKRHQLLSRWLIPGLFQFHSDMDRYNASNNGLTFTNVTATGDHMLWGFLPTRISVTMLLRYLWQFPSQRQSLFQALTMPDESVALQSSAFVEPRNGSTLQLIGLVSGLWGDIAKLFDEANDTITTLRQIHELIEDSMDGSAVVLPFRRDMLDGYVASNAKQLRLTMRLLLEALELTSWFASVVSNETNSYLQSSSVPAAALQYVLLQPLVVEQATRIITFLISSLANVHDAKDWMFSLPLVDDGKLLLAHLIVLVVRYARHSARESSKSSVAPSICSHLSFWKIVRSSGDIMKRRVGDMDTHVRWGLNALCTRMESASYFGSMNLDDDDDLEQMRTVMTEAGHELDEYVADTLLEKQTVSTVNFVSDTAKARKRLGKRFIATLAKDGRFDFKMFVGQCRFLQLEPTQESDSGDNADEEAEGVKKRHLYIDDSLVQQFIYAMQEADEMIQVQKAMEACLGDVPDQYLDPLLSTLMVDPVRLPSGNIVDRAVIARHLLASSQQGGSTGSDPFTREPLTMTMVEPCDSLRYEIQMYLRTKMQHFRKTAREDVLATWGIGWDVLFDNCSETEGNSEDGDEGGNDTSKVAVSR